MSTYQKQKPCVVSQVDAQNGPSQDHNTSIASITSPIAPSQDTSDTVRTLTQLLMAEPVMAVDIGHSQHSISTGPTVCIPNCLFQDPLNIVHANQSSTNIQTLTPQRHTIVSESAAVDTLIGPYQDQQTVISSLCYPNCPFQGTLNSVSMSTYQKQKPCVVSQVDVQNGPSQDHNTSIASITSPIAPSQDTSDTV